jgi:hypothetical protein
MIQILQREEREAETVELAAALETEEKSGAAERWARLRGRGWRFWAIAGVGAAVVAAVLLWSLSPTRGPDEGGVRVIADPAPPLPSAQAPGSGRSEAVAAEGYAVAPPPVSAPMQAAGMAQAGMVSEKAQTAQGAAGPMIARTVSLVILVKNVAEARGALDAILAGHHGYAAQLTISTPEAGARSFQSSLRVPAPELQAALEAMRALGRVQTETQSGEEVTQQHADLVARLQNARETEARLRQILNERTGKMKDVLDVEEKISETRGEIEQMDAQQKALEHRVDFATVELTLTEEYKVQLTGNSISTGTQMRNSLVAGIRHAGSSLLGLVLFLEEFGPVMLIWMVILGAPMYGVWRYRRARRAGA